MSDIKAKPAPRTIQIRGRAYPVFGPSLLDPRLHVAAVLLTIQALGQTVLNFRLSIAQILISLAVGALTEFGVAFFKDHQVLWPASGLLTGNSVAIILRVPGTLHGQWWSLHGIEIFIGAVAISMASKYLIRWKGRHIFNPSNLGLVLGFVALGPQRTEPQDLWWIPMGPWLIATYAILIVGGLLIGWRLRLLGMQLAFMAGFAIMLVLALAPEPDHCMIASWRLAPICGRSLWEILVYSPEVLIFGLFMLPDPRTVPDSQMARVIFGLAVALFSVLLLGPTILEFWTKTAILAGLLVTSALRFPVGAFLAPRTEGEESGRRWPVPVAIVTAALLVGCVPLSSDVAARSPYPTAGLSDGSIPTIAMSVGEGPGPGPWVTQAASEALPKADPNGRPVAQAMTVRTWHLPAVPKATIPSDVHDYDPKITQPVADQMVHDLVLDLVIEAEARRTHDTTLAGTGAIGDGLTPFLNTIRDDQAAGRTVSTVYRFDRATLVIYLPKRPSQGARLLGIAIRGTAATTTRDRAGAATTKSDPYSRNWSLGAPPTGAAGPEIIDNDYSDLKEAN